MSLQRSRLLRRETGEFQINLTYCSYYNTYNLCTEAKINVLLVIVIGNEYILSLSTSHFCFNHLVRSVLSILTGCGVQACALLAALFPSLHLPPCLEGRKEMHWGKDTSMQNAKLLLGLCLDIFKVRSKIYACIRVLSVLYIPGCRPVQGCMICCISGTGHAAKSQAFSCHKSLVL